MRIDRLSLKNFKGFESREFALNPEFNLIIGKNGTGKTSALDALSIALGSWFLGIRGVGTRHIRADEVMLKQFIADPSADPDGEQAMPHWDQVFPCEITARGEVQGQVVDWSRCLNSPSGRTTYREAQHIKNLSADADNAVRKGKPVSLPLISYYGTGRLWQEPRDFYQVDDPEEVADKKDSSRLSGYANSIDPRLSVKELTRWIARQSWIAFQQSGRAMPVFATVKEAMIACVEGATDLYFDARRGEAIVDIDGVVQPFSNLSDGQRCTLAMVGDMAQKAASLNPQFGAEVLQKTPGVVLIDELDLHLHPRWQRRIIEDLRQTFPKIQFICTTHSPFLIQSLRSGEELLMLDGQPTAQVANLPLENIKKNPIIPLNGSD